MLATKPRISVLVPTRRRTHLFTQMLKSLRETAADALSVEVIARIDFDDPESAEYLRKAGVLTIVGPHGGYESHPRMFNECARLASADLLLGLNDDVIFGTPGWDTRLVEEAAKYPDGIFNIGVDSVMNPDHFVFPFVSRTLINLFGCLFHEQLIYPDIWLRDVLMPFGRAIRIYDVTIIHRWVGLSSDQQQVMGKAHTPEYHVLYNACVQEGRDKVQKWLQSASQWSNATTACAS